MLDAFDFPNISHEGFRQTSDCTWDYNCIAWAAGKTDKWWWPFNDPLGNEAYWPRRLSRDLRTSTFADLFKHRGYKPCQNGDLEEGFLKVAIYAKDGKATHAARQLPDGTWTHKLGSDMDLTTTLHAVEGPIYGEVVRFLRIKISKAPQPGPV